jgi:hypothetical protein
LSEAVAEIEMVPDTVEPEAGEEIETVGGVVSVPAAVVNVKSPLVERRPEESWDLTRKW